MNPPPSPDREELLRDLARIEERLKEYGLPSYAEILTHACRFADEPTLALLRKAQLGLERVTSSQEPTNGPDVPPLPREDDVRQSQ